MANICRVIKWVNTDVMVFGDDGERMPAYEGPIATVKTPILNDAPAKATFWTGIRNMGDIVQIRREEF